MAESAAAATALAKVPGGRISGGELEEEDGRLIYSYDIVVPGREGVEEIHVDALTGAVVKTEHESESAAKAEAAEDAKKGDPKKADAKAARPTKRPPPGATIRA